MRHIFIFLACFVVGAMAALAVRTARHQPHPVLPAAVAAPAPSSPGATATAGPGNPVNTTCAICGMPVDPRLPTATYQGKTIGFGCRMCPPKFQADPERYGPAFLGATSRPTP